MNNYFSDFISRFGGGNLGLTISDHDNEQSAKPQINYITLYNPLWAPDKDESVQALSKQILFFLKQNENDSESNVEEKLNMIGLIRGSSSLASDFGQSTHAVSIHITDGMILSVEIEKDYFLSVSVSGRCDESASKDVYGKQLEILLWEWHSTFILFHLSFTKLRKMHGDPAFKEMVKDHWGSFMCNYNCGAESAYGPINLTWPNRTNSRGFFRFLPWSSYKVSSIKLADSQKAKLKDAVFGESKTSAVLIANLSKDVPKRRGIMFMGCQPTLQENEIVSEMRKVYNIFESLDSHGCLQGTAISPKSKDLYTALREKWQKERNELETEVELDSDDEDPDLSMSAYAATLEALHPATITNKLLVLPINETINGFKSLGLVVTELITTAPSWFNVWGETPQEPSVEDLGLEPDSTKGEFLVGLVGNEITRVLVNVPLTSNGKTETVEMLIVAYVEDETLIILAFESGIEELEKKEFYGDLQHNMMENLMELTTVGNLTAMGNSIGSLDSIGFDIRGNNLETHDEIDRGFFYIVYDIDTRSYQSSLPTLPTFLRPHEPTTGPKKSLYKIMFHLHDRLIAHFMSKGKIFSQNSVATEILHKFSSRKSGDWMFYLIRHEKKIIIIIKNSNSKQKARNASNREDSYLIKAADSLYGAANLGFLDSIGEDIRIWLGGLSEGQP